MHEADAMWLSLAQPWQRAFDAAWASWRSGSAAVGAAVTNAEGAVIAVGQNRMLDPPGSGRLAGTLMAHAEMDALADLALGEYGGYALYTTYEPCFMCAATIIGTYHIPKVFFAAYDPYWPGLFDAFGQHPAIARWLPEREHLGGPYGALAQVLHLTWILRYAPATHEAHQDFAPAHLALAHDLLQRDALQHLEQDGAGPADVARSLWADLGRLPHASKPQPRRN
jgi:tRNA(Arg) A34 adenosine deaminase TadA